MNNDQNTPATPQTTAAKNTAGDRTTNGIDNPKGTLDEATVGGMDRNKILFGQASQQASEDELKWLIENGIKLRAQIDQHAAAMDQAMAQGNKELRKLSTSKW
jgi:hypothetical protein